MVENSIRFEGYLAVLETRKKAYHRNVVIAGGLLIFAILCTTGTLLFTAWNERSIWLMGIFDLLSTINFLMAWVRYEMNNQKIDLVKNLQIRD